MPVSFAQIEVGQQYSTMALARMWGHASHHHLTRGVVTPRDDNKIILFVTQDKLTWRTPYADRLVGDVLHWEGPQDHFAEARMAVHAATSDDEVHLFYRDRPNAEWTYKGEVRLLGASLHDDKPSRFTWRLMYRKPGERVAMRA